MIKLISEKIPRILKTKKQLEKKLNLKISNRGKEIYLEGNPEDEYIGEKVIEAIEFGFPINATLLIKEEDFLFEKVNIKEHTPKKDLERIRGRIIGKSGKALKTLSSLTDCFFELKDNEIGIIGSSENIANAKNAIISIIQGSKHANVYAHLEKNKPLPITDLGLKEKE